MKNLFKTMLPCLLLLGSIVGTALPVLAQSNQRKFIQIDGRTSMTAELDPRGSATVNNVSPGKYGVTLLVPAVQKVRMAGSNPAAADDKHKQWIDIESWSWGTSNSSYDHKTGGGVLSNTTGGTNYDHSKGGGSITTSGSPETPLRGSPLRGSPLRGSPLRAQLNQTITHNGEKYYAIKLGDIQVTGMAPAQANGERPAETLSLNFEEIKFK